MALLITKVSCWSSRGAVLKAGFEAPEKAEKCRKLCKMAFSPYLSVSPLQHGCLNLVLVTMTYCLYYVNVKGMN